MKIPWLGVQVDFERLTSVCYTVIRHLGTFEPNIVRNSLLAYLAFEAIASQGRRVAMCGEGADELFWGYADFGKLETDIARENLSKDLFKDLFRTQLLRVDRMSMAWGVEARVPFMDGGNHGLKRCYHPRVRAI